MANNLIQFRVHHGLAAGHRYDRSLEFGQLVDAPLHYIKRDRFGSLIVFVAVTAGEIAAAHGNDVRQHDMIRR